MEIAIINMSKSLLVVDLLEFTKKNLHRELHFVCKGL